MDAPGQWQVLAADLALADRAAPDARTVLDRPSVEQVIGLFDRLGTGEGGDLFISGAPGERALMVAGGPTCYLVSCVGEKYGAYNLVDPSAKGRGEWITLTAGGVPSAVEVSATVSEERARQAIRYFHAHGDIDPQLEWE